MRLLLAMVCVLVWSCPVFAGAETRVLFLDGARIERELPARDGYLEMSLPATMLPNSLRIKPLGDATISRVDIVPLRADRKPGPTAAVVLEKRDALRHRLQVLAEREAIFKAAAKSQSGRAPRKTKTNPEPLEMVRTGTSFALGQLEAVHVQQRKVEKELAALEASLADRGATGNDGSTVRVWLSRPAGRVRIAFLSTGSGWQPRYDFRLAGNGEVETVLRAKLPAVPAKTSLSVVPWSLADAWPVGFAPRPVQGDLAPIASFRLAALHEDLVVGAVPSLALAFTNTSGIHFPPGEAVGYWQGEYLGATPFPGCRSNDTLTLVFGR
jgi:hypothetical protein